MKYPIVICSYPRSGSTWLRFILCHLNYPGQQHDFASVNRLIPPIDDPHGVLNGIDKPIFYKSHALETCSNVVLLHRHVGDVLESEWWYKKKMWGEARPLEEYLEVTKYGEEWRTHINHYFPAPFNISYNEIGREAVLQGLCPDRFLVDITVAIAKGNFGDMQEAEKAGFGIYATGDEQIKFCRKGTSDQWKEWSPRLQAKLLAMNRVELKKLGYA